MPPKRTRAAKGKQAAKRRRTGVAGTRTFTCPECGLQVRLTRNTAVVSKKKSLARVAAGKALAKRLKRDPDTGRFLPVRGGIPAGEGSSRDRF